MSNTYKENAELIKNNLSIRSYLESCTTVRGNRAICPLCKNKKFTMALDDDKQFATCFTGCTKGGNPRYPDKQTADVIDLYSLINGINNIEALNELIANFNIKRFTGDYDPSNKIIINTEYKKKAHIHLNEMHDRLYILKLLKYDKLNKANKYEYCCDIINRIDLFLNQLKINQFSEETGRKLYKEGLVFCKLIDNIYD